MIQSKGLAHHMPWKQKYPNSLPNWISKQIKTKKSLIILSKKEKTKHI